jgi:hypothetical protein
MATDRLAHNVFFTLKDKSPVKLGELVAACRTYLNIQPGIVFFAAGTLVGELTREVNDRDWDVGLHLVFIDKAAHDAYQTDPSHVRFVDEQKYNWARVRVFDSYV